MDTDYPFECLPINNVDHALIESVFRSAGVTPGTISGSELNKSRLNAVYTELRHRFCDLLYRRDLAAWIHQGYRQLELWTAVYGFINRPDDELFELKQDAPLGRYGWRHVIDIALSELDPTAHISRGSLNAADIRCMYSICAFMYLVSEASNAIHHFAPRIGEPICTYDFSTFSVVCVEYPPAGSALWKNIQEYNVSPNHYDTYPQLHPYTNPNTPIMCRVDALLRKSFGFALDDAMVCIKFLITALRGQGTIMLHSGPYIARWVSDETGLTPERVDAFLDFCLLTQKVVRTAQPDFLRKAPAQRMSHYAGVMLPKLHDVRPLYSHIKSIRAQIADAGWHILISPIMLAEWKNTFGLRILQGLRSDLKTNVALRNEIELIEDGFRRGIFEVEVEKVMKSHSFSTLRSVREIGPSEARIALPCGEIDVLGYGGRVPTLLVVECKATAGAVDVRTLASDVDAYFNGKGYHQKLTAKVDWAKANLTHIESEFASKHGIASVNPTDVTSVFVTLNPHPAKFLQTEHKVMRIDEFDAYLAAL